MADEIEGKDRDKDGKFIVGNKSPGGRYKRSKREMTQLLISVTELAYTPEEMVYMIRDTYNMAVDKGDWKGMYAIVSLVLAYGIGKPVQRSLTAQIDPEDIRRMFRPEETHDEEVDSDDIVDGESHEL